MTPAPPSEPAPDDALSQLDPRQRAQLEQYLELLLQSAELFNLTAIREREEAWSRHVVESVRLVPLLAPAKRLLDVGSGGGVPGLILAITCPETAVTLLEATAKKARFLEQTAEALELENLTVLCDRAESAGAVSSPYREQFDVVTARAVAPLRVLIELTAPLARIGGQIVAVKGEKAAEELVASTNALSRLHVTHERTVRQPTASVVLLRKSAATSVKYPRRAGEPSRNPL